MAWIFSAAEALVLLVGGRLPVETKKRSCFYLEL